jgi:uncharacterized secreted protein with C-terminal beta-propeller domain
MHTRLTLSALILLATGCPSAPKPEAPSIGLSRFESCAALRSYVVDGTVEMLVQSSYGYDVALAVDDSGSESGSSGPSSYSGTNVQEARVDEPDMVKTDGTHIFAIHNNAISIIKSWPVEETKEIAQITVEGHPSSLFLHQDRLIVLSQDWETRWPGEEDLGYGTGETRITIFDVRDREAPELIRSTNIQGQLIGARMVDSQMVLTTRHNPAIPVDLYESAWRVMESDSSWETWYRGTVEEQDALRDELRLRLRPVVEEAIWSIPTAGLLLSVEEDGEIASASGCTGVYRGDDISSPEMMSMVHIDMGNRGPGGEVQTTTIMAGGTTMYASEDHIYIAQGSFNWWWGWSDVDRTTRIHRFDLQDKGTTYAASGEVPGWLHNQFSMSEYEGRLRVATTDMDWWWGTETDGREAGNNVYILEPAQGQLRIIGAIEGLAPGEQIYAARFQGDKGFLVTFRQVDPLFTLDLSDPTNPKAVGELKIPGYSAYLQTRGKDRLIGVGMDGTDDGQLTGVSVSLFDVSDFAAPSQIDRVTVASEWASSEALWDHHAITIHGNILTVPYWGYEETEESWGYIQGLLVVNISKNDLSERTRINHSDLVSEVECSGGWDCGDGDEWDARIRRAIVMDDYLFTVSDYGIKVSDLASGEDKVASVVFR